MGRKKYVLDPSLEGSLGPTIINTGTGTLNNVVSDENTVPAAMIAFTGASNMSVTGIAGGVESREIKVYNNNINAKLTLKHEDINSSVGNRIICPNGADFVLSYQEGAQLVYSNLESKWRITSRGIPTGVVNDVVALDGYGGLKNLGQLPSSGLPTGGSNGEIIRLTSGNPTWSDQDLPTLNTASDGVLNNLISVDGSGAPVGAIRFTGENNIDLTGIAGGYDGRRLLLIMAGTGEGNTLTIYDDDGGSDAANRFALSSSEIEIGDTILLQYDGPQAKWKIAGQPPVVLPTFYSSLDIQNLYVGSINYSDLFGKWSAGTVLGSVTTSSVTPLDVPIYNDIAGDGIYYLEATVIMTRLTDATKAGVYKRSVLYRRVNFGTVTIVGSVQTPVPDQETTAGDDVTLVANGPSIQVRVTAADSDPRRWLIEYNYKSMNSDP